MTVAGANKANKSKQVILRISALIRIPSKHGCSRCKIKGADSDQRMRVRHLASVKIHRLTRSKEAKLLVAAISKLIFPRM